MSQDLSQPGCIHSTLVQLKCWIQHCSTAALHSSPVEIAQPGLAVCTKQFTFDHVFEYCQPREEVRESSGSSLDKEKQMRGMCFTSECYRFSSISLAQQRWTSTLTDSLHLLDVCLLVSSSQRKSHQLLEYELSHWLLKQSTAYTFCSDTL